MPQLAAAPGNGAAEIPAGALAGDPDAAIAEALSAAAPNLRQVGSSGSSAGSMFGKPEPAWNGSQADCQQELMAAAEQAPQAAAAEAAALCGAVSQNGQHAATLQVGP